jgi:hypothetical protein
MAHSSLVQAPKPANPWLKRFRSWHVRAGALAAACLLLAGLTGIFLNHKAFFLGLLGAHQPPNEPAKSPPARPTGGLRLASALTAPAVSWERALALAQERWGDVELEKIELKFEQQQLAYRIKQRQGSELIIDASTAEVVEKGRYEKLGPRGPDGQPARSFDWGKFALDLHTGKIFGSAGRVLMSACALVLVTLSLTGLWLWAAPQWRRRSGRRA